MSDHDASPPIEKMHIVAELKKSVVKEALKEALKEWLDEKYLMFGKLTLHGIAAAALAALVYFILAWHGWRHTP